MSHRFYTGVILAAILCFIIPRAELHADGTCRCSGSISASNPAAGALLNGACDQLRSAGCSACSASGATCNNISFPSSQADCTQASTDPAATARRLLPAGVPVEAALAIGISISGQRCEFASGATAPAGGSNPSGGAGGSGGSNGASASQGTSQSAESETTADAEREHLYDPLENVSVPEIIGNIIKSLWGLAGALFLVFLLYGGFLWMTAGGDGEGVKKAQKVIMRSLYGMAIVLFSYSILNLLLNGMLLVRSTANEPVSENTSSPASSESAPAATGEADAGCFITSRRANNNSTQFQTQVRRVMRVAPGGALPSDSTLTAAFSCTPNIDRVEDQNVRCVSRGGCPSGQHCCVAAR